MLRDRTTAQRHLHKRYAKDREHILRALLTAKDEALSKRANRIEECCSYPLVALTGDGTPKLVLGCCRDRMCPRCQALRARDTAAKIERLVREMDQPRFATFTLQHIDGEPLHAMLDRLMEAFRELRKDSRWKARVVGGVWCIEAKIGNDGNWHAHLHMVLDGTYYPQRELSIDWAKASRGSMIVDIRAVHSRRGVASYVAKYVTKAERITDWNADRICEYAAAMHGKRLVHTFGTMHGKTKGAALDQIDREEIHPACTVARIVKAASEGSQAAREAESLLRRCGSTWRALIPCRGEENPGSLPPLDAGEKSLLVLLLAFVSERTATNPLDTLDTSRSSPRPQIELFARTTQLETVDDGPLPF